MLSLCSLKGCQKIGYFKCECLSQKASLCQEHMQLHITKGGDHSINDTFKQHAIEAVSQLKKEVLQTKTHAVQTCSQLFEIIEKKLSQTIETANQWSEECDVLIEYLNSLSYSALRVNKQLTDFIQTNYFEKIKLWTAPEFKQTTLKLKNLLKNCLKLPKNLLIDQTGELIVSESIQKLSPCIKKDLEISSVVSEPELSPSVKQLFKRYRSNTPVKNPLKKDPPQRTLPVSYPDLLAKVDTRLSELQRNFEFFNKNLNLINYPVSNFGMFLKYKNEHILSVWYAIDSTLKEEHPSKKGIFDLDEQDNLLKTLAKKHQLELKIRQKFRSEINFYVEKFKGVYSECWTYVYFIRFLQKRDFQNAFETVYLQFKTCYNKLIISSDMHEAYNIFVLMITTQINIFLESDNLEGALELIEFLPQAVYFLKPKNPIMNQLDMRLYSIINKSSNKVLIDETEAARRTMKRTHKTYNRDFAEMDIRVRNLRQFLDDFNPYEWIEEWNLEKGFMPELYMQLKNQLKGEKFYPWNAIARNIISRKILCKENEFLKLERIRKN